MTYLQGISDTTMTVMPMRNLYILMFALVHIMNKVVACYSPLLLIAGVSSDPDVLPWWNYDILYQIYPRSFQDSDGDGIGDIQGIIQRSSYLKEIGVGAVYLNSIFKSPMYDFGYDISNYREVDPVFGTKEDLLRMLKVLKQCGIKVLLDLVPNHTSDQHVWFVKSVAREAPYTDYYVWADGICDPQTNATRPPNNWLSGFTQTGPAWEYNEERQQYYLHQFSKHQPDLNYRNPRVVNEIKDVIRYWLDYGFDGWRVDSAPYLFEDSQLRDEPALPGTCGDTAQNLDHINTQNLPQTYALTKEMANIVDEYIQKDGKPRLFLLEAYANFTQTVEYIGKGALNFLQPFNFQLQTYGSVETRAYTMRDLIQQWLAAIPENAPTNWAIGNHDQERVANRYGVDTVDAMNMLLGILPGLWTVYNGNEIGMQDTYLRFDQTRDNLGLVLGPSAYQTESRDPERTPMQWDNSPSAGFSTNYTTWLPVNPNYYTLNVAQQQCDARSHLKVFQDVARARQDLVLKRGSVDVIAPDNDTLLVIRELNQAKFVLVFNMGSFVRNYTSDNTFIAYGIDDNYTVNVSSINAVVTKGTLFNKGLVNFSLRPRSAVLLRTTASST